MKPASQNLLIVTASIFLVIEVSCIILGAPIRSIPNSIEFVEILQVPEVLNRGDVGTFSLKTTTGNLCFGTIIYNTYEREEIKEIDLPELEANTDGICQWDWKVPPDAKTGTAVFRAAAEQNGIHDSISPYTFCIEECPWIVPTGKP